MRKPRLPPARSLEITKRKPRGQRSHRLATTWHNPKASNDTAMALGKWDQKGETWCEPELRWKRQTRKRHLEPPQIPLRCALSIFTITKTLTIVRWVIAVSRVRWVGTGSIKMLRRFLHLCVYSCLHEYYLLACVPSVRRSCSLMMPDRSSVRCSDVQVASSDCWTQARLLA